jgi:hypothetical protein
MSTNELEWIGSGGDRALILGAGPKLSIDPRIRCPHTFTNEFPPPPPPNERYSELACKAAITIVKAVWLFRSYVEIIKVGYTLDDRSPDRVYLVGEIILIDPRGDKIHVTQKINIGASHGAITSDEDWRERLMRFDLTGPEQAYERVICSLVDLLMEEKKVVLKKKAGEYAELTNRMETFQKLTA